MSVVCNDGRIIVGVLRGFDQLTNLILEDSYERLYSRNKGVENWPLGLYVVRGDNVSIVGEIDDEADEELQSKFDTIRAAPLRPVTH